tara:strand:+ start:771 stop:956 length:186 start_codon:yes stop_codon:yes gene_type:complete
MDASERYRLIEQGDMPDPADEKVGASTAEQLLHHLQWMRMVGDDSYQIVEQLARQLIDEGY